MNKSKVIQDQIKAIESRIEKRQAYQSKQLLSFFETKSGQAYIEKTDDLIQRLYGLRFELMDSKKAAQ
jgi:peptidoglycan hydrolase CwlO-like protein